MGWAFVLSCTAPDFLSVHPAAGEVCDNDAIRELVAGTFFGGNLGFDALEVGALLATGTGDAIVAGAEGATGWLADVDWPGLTDWF